MKLTDGDGNAVSSVGLGLTRDEVEQLIGKLEELLEHPTWHGHVSSPDFDREVTVWIEEPLGASGSNRASDG